MLAPAARDAMRRGGLPSNTVDFYLRWRVPGVNGFAAGWRSVAVSRASSTHYGTGHSPRRDCTISVDGARYSVPRQHVDEWVWIRWAGDVHGHQAIRPRTPERVVRPKLG